MTSPSAVLTSSATITKGSPFGKLSGQKRAFDLVVVGDRYGAQPDLARGGEDRLDRAGAVLGEVGVDVKIGVDPVGPRGPAPAWRRRRRGGLLTDAAHVQRVAGHRGLGVARP